MNHEETRAFCDVIGCRRLAAVVQVRAEIENEEWLCEACFRNLELCRPDLAEFYNRVRSAGVETEHLAGAGRSAAGRSDL